MSSIFYMLNNFFASSNDTIVQDDEKNDDYDLAGESEDEENSQSESEDEEKEVVLHNNEGPAVFKDKGNEQEWWCNGKRHRVDGPAIIRKGMRSYKDISYDEERNLEECTRYFKMAWCYVIHQLHNNIIYDK